MGPLSRWHLQMGHMRVRMQLPGDPRGTGAENLQGLNCPRVQHYP